MTKAEHVALLEQLAQYAPQRLKNRVALIVTEMLAPEPAAPQTLADVQREMDVAAEVASQSATEHREALADVMLSALKKRKAPKVS